MLDDPGGAGSSPDGGPSADDETESPPIRSSARGEPIASAQATTSPATLSLPTTLGVPSG